MPGAGWQQLWRITYDHGGAASVRQPGRGSITESIFIGKGQQPAAKQSPTRDPDTGRGEQRAGTKIFTARSGSVFSLKSIKNE